MACNYDDPTERDAFNKWSRGIDWCVAKKGRQWSTAPCFGFAVLFRTKKAAYEACTAFVLERSRRNAEISQRDLPGRVSAAVPIPR